MPRPKTRTKRSFRKHTSSVSVSPDKPKQNKSRVMIISALLVLFFIAASVIIFYLKTSKVADIRIGDCLIKAEIADTPHTRKKGLSGRDHLKADHGMLFVFDYIRKRSFWMKDTRIPISIAFISSDGTILQIEQMEPFDLHAVTSHSPVQYVLEVNKGFFKENGIVIGMHVDLSDI